MKREDGNGETSKMYWMTAGKSMFPKNRKYVFGKSGGPVFALAKQDMRERESIERMAERILAQAGVRKVAHHGAFTVI